MERGSAGTGGGGAAPIRRPSDVKLDDESFLCKDEDDASTRGEFNVWLFFGRKVLFREEYADRATDGAMEGVVRAEVPDRMDMVSLSLGFRRLCDRVSDPPHWDSALLSLSEGLAWWCRRTLLRVVISRPLNASISLRCSASTA